MPCLPIRSNLQLAQTTVMYFPVTYCTVCFISIRFPNRLVNNLLSVSKDLNPTLALGERKGHVVVWHALTLPIWPNLELKCFPNNLYALSYYISHSLLHLNKNSNRPNRPIDKLLIVSKDSWTTVTKWWNTWLIILSSRVWVPPLALGERKGHGTCMNALTMKYLPIQPN